MQFPEHAPLIRELAACGVPEKNRHGTLAINGTNIHSDLTSGTLSLGSTNTLPPPAILVTGGTLDVANSDTVTAVTTPGGTPPCGNTARPTPLPPSPDQRGGTTASTNTGTGTGTVNATNPFTGAVAVKEDPGTSP